MIWRLITTGTLDSGADGAEAVYSFDVQEFGLTVDEVTFAVEISGRSSTGARVRLHQDNGASESFAGFVTTSPDPIPLTSVAGNLPTTLVGTASLSMPYFRVSIGVSSADGQQESVIVKVYVGGRTRN